MDNRYLLKKDNNGVLVRELIPMENTPPPIVIEKIEVKIPTIKIPTIKIPTIKIPTIKIPTIKPTSNIDRAIALEKNRPPIIVDVVKQLPIISPIISSVISLASLRTNVVPNNIYSGFGTGETEEIAFKYFLQNYKLTTYRYTYDKLKIIENYGGTNRWYFEIMCKTIKR